MTGIELERPYWNVFNCVAAFYNAKELVEYFEKLGMPLDHTAN